MNNCNCNQNCKYNCFCYKKQKEKNNNSSICYGQKLANLKPEVYQYYLEITIKLSPLLGVNSYVLLGLRSKPSY